MVRSLTMARTPPLSSSSPPSPLLPSSSSPVFKETPTPTARPCAPGRQSTYPARPHSSLRHRVATFPLGCRRRIARSVPVLSRSQPWAQPHGSRCRSYPPFGLHLHLRSPGLTSLLPRPRSCHRHWLHGSSWFRRHCGGTCSPGLGWKGGTADGGMAFVDSHGALCRCGRGRGCGRGHLTYHSRLQPHHTPRHHILYRPGPYLVGPRHRHQRRMGQRGCDDV
mmetsp:Transcript_69447/g.163249  ORF Transcript_69447/g.163249 Transcript_69447/m.163249 type:complete len:222 (-) Transcript_69447:330-995(-)